MSGTSAALFRREIGRLAAGRVFLFGGLFALLALAMTAAGRVVMAVVGQHDPVDQVAVLLTTGYRATDFYDTIVFVLALVMGADQIGADIRAGTIFSVLARPVSRASLFLTGFAASATAIVGLELLRSGSIFGPVLWIQGRLGLAQLLGAVAIALGELLILAVFAALGSVMPPAYAVLAGLAGTITLSLAYNGSLGGLGSKLVDGVTWLLPLLHGQQDVISQAIQGSEQSSGPIIEVVAYRACWTALLVALGVWGFSRRDLAPKV